MAQSMTTAFVEEGRNFEPASRDDGPQPRFSSDRITTYLRKIGKVEGWIDGLSAEAVVETSRFQVASGIRGAVSEIGIHHGKLFLLLYLTTAKREKAVAIDVFDLQEYNVDNSGLGNKRQFLKNVRKFAGTDEGLEIVQDSSLHLTPERLKAVAGGFRLFSVDGCHTEEATLNDLRLADAVLSDEGVLIVDDFFNHGWPEVSVAVAKFLMAGDAGLVPYAITPSKVFLCRPAMQGLYIGFLERHFGQRLDKRARFFDHDIAMLGSKSWSWKARFARTPLGGVVKRALGPLVKYLR
jgi:hypothetical protein